MTKTYYYDSSSDEGIESNIALGMAIEKTLDIFDNLSEAEGSFIGIKNDNFVIQFAWSDNNLWIADIPNLQQRGSFQKRCDYGQCVEIIRSAFNKSDWQVPNDFTFVSW